MGFKSALTDDDKELELKVKVSSTEEMRDIIDRLDASVVDEPEGDCGCDHHQMGSHEDEVLNFAFEGLEEAKLESGRKVRDINSGAYGKIVKQVGDNKYRVQWADGKTSVEKWGSDASTSGFLPEGLEEGCKPGCPCGCGHAHCGCHQIHEDSHDRRKYINILNKFDAFFMHDAGIDYVEDWEEVIRPYLSRTPNNQFDELNDADLYALAKTAKDLFNNVKDEMAEINEDSHEDIPFFFDSEEGLEDALHYLDKRKIKYYYGKDDALMVPIDAAYHLEGMLLNYDHEFSNSMDVREGIINKASKTASGAVSGARVGRMFGPTGAAAGAAIGGALGYKSADAEDKSKKELDEDNGDNFSSKDLENLLSNQLNDTCKVLDSEYMGKYGDHDFYEVLCSVESDTGMKFYTIKDVLYKDGKVSVSEIDYTNANLARAMAQFDKHVADMRAGMDEEVMHEDCGLGIEELKASDKWTRRPKRLDDIPDKSSMKVTSIMDFHDLEILHDDEVFGNRIEGHDNIGKKTFKKPVPDIFILETDDAAYLIKTEGADYVRYAMKLIDDTPEDDIHADLKRMRQLSGQDPLGPIGGVEEVPMMGVREDSLMDTDDDKQFWNAPNDPTDYDHQADFDNVGHTKRSNKVTNNQGDNPMPSPDEKETAFVKESKDIFAKLSEDWNKYEGTATSGYLNRPLRTEKEARKDIEKAKKKREKAEKKAGKK